MRSSKKSLKPVKDQTKKHDANHNHAEIVEPEEVKPEKTDEQIEAENKIKFTLGLNKVLAPSTKNDNLSVSSRSRAGSK